VEEPSASVAITGAFSYTGRVPKTMRVPHTSRALRCVGFVTIQMCVDHRDAPTLGIILTA